MHYMYIYYLYMHIYIYIDIYIYSNQIKRQVQLYIRLYNIYRILFRWFFAIF